MTINNTKLCFMIKSILNIQDLFGEDGLKVIDKNNRIIRIQATYFVVVNPNSEAKQYTREQVLRMNDAINSELNHLNLSVLSGEYSGYSIEFDLIFRESETELDATLSAAELEGYGNVLSVGKNSNDVKILKEMFMKSAGLLRGISI